jgi:hypothetical protein
MIWIGGSQIFLIMAIDTFNTKHIEAHHAFRLVTLVAVSGTVCTQQRKPSFLMYLVNIADKP